MFNSICVCRRIVHEVEQKWATIWTDLASVITLDSMYEERNIVSIWWVCVFICVRIYKSHHKKFVWSVIHCYNQTSVQCNCKQSNKYQNLVQTFLFHWLCHILTLTTFLYQNTAMDYNKYDAETTINNMLCTFIKFFTKITSTDTTYNSNRDTCTVVNTITVQRTEIHIL